MSLARLDSIDIVMHLPNSPRMALIAVDGGEVPESPAREDALAKKLAAYLQYVISGQYAKDHPQHLDKEVCILVMCTQPPTEGMKQISQIGDRRHPETYLSVAVFGEAEFYEFLGQAKPVESKPKPWWKFW